ncbi:MAG: hypothetical protein CV087_03835 [Candidatus Brocadia sp. WS118]|nr:MAG: hypothetical protein CV087_03835 [Candidatus Brocadia sp. WS118]
MQLSKYNRAEVVEKAENLPYITTVVLRLMEIISNPDVSVHEVVGAIKKDQGLVARVFKVANSTFYGRLKKADNLNDAVVTLGLRGLNSLVLAEAVKQVLMTADVGDQSLWKHAVKVSIASVVLANELRCDAFDDALVGGLVHDIGKAFIEGVYPEIPSLIEQKVVKDRVTYEDAELSIVGFDHAEIGALITEKWNFPPKMIDVIRHHHTPNDMKDVCVESQELIRIIKLANVISRQYEQLPNLSMDDRLYEKLSSHDAFDLTPDRLTYLMEEIKIKWENENNIFY